MPDNPLTETELIAKLVQRFHLSVAERRALPNHQAKASLIVEAIVDALLRHGWYPTDWRPQMAFAGGVIELVSPATARIHWQTEISVSRYEATGVSQELPLRDAAVQWLRRMYPDDIDGIAIDWDA